MEITEDNRKLFRIIAPHLSQYPDNIKASGDKLVHYTSARNCKSILTSQAFWLRHFSKMNDSSEVSFGAKKIKAYFDPDTPTGSAFWNTVRAIVPDYAENIQRAYQDFLDINDQTEIYIASLSRHPKSEDTLGRLSMWRAYADDAGVALVFKPEVFFSETNELKAYSSPVFYNEDAIRRFFQEMLVGLIENTDFLKQQDYKIINNSILLNFLVSACVIKHPGFQEENELRILYFPKVIPSEVILEEIVEIKDVQQKIYKIPMRDFSGTSFIGTHPKTVIDRIIIGPTANSADLRVKFISILKELGVEDAEQKVVDSEIPLRR